MRHATADGLVLGGAEAAEDDETVDDVSQCSNLIVNYLPHTVGETELRRLFAPHGTIEHVKVVTDRLSGKSKGFGFVRFSTDQEALEAIASKNGLEFGRKRIKVRGELTVSRTFLAPATLPARLTVGSSASTFIMSWIAVSASIAAYDTMIVYERSEYAVSYTHLTLPTKA